MITIILSMLAIAVMTLAVLMAMVLAWMGFRLLLTLMNNK